MSSELEQECQRLLFAAKQDLVKYNNIQPDDPAQLMWEYRQNIKALIKFHREGNVPQSMSRAVHKFLHEDVPAADCLQDCLDLDDMAGI